MQKIRTNIYVCAKILVSQIYTSEGIFIMTETMLKIEDLPTVYDAKATEENHEGTR